MLAFHNEHIASCAFLTYFSPESTTAAAAAAAAATSASTTVPQATHLNDKQAITGITCICCSPVGSRCRHKPYLHCQKTQQHSKTFVKSCSCPSRAVQKSLLQQKQQQQHQQQQQQQQQKRQFLHLMQFHQLQVTLMKQQKQQRQQQQQQQQQHHQQHQAQSQQQQQNDMFLASSSGLDKIVVAKC